MTQEEMSVFEELDKLLGSTDIENLTADSAVFEDLKDGYYLSEVEKAELKVSKSGKPMVSFKFKTVEEGYDVVMSESGEVSLNKLNKTKGRYIFINFLLSDEASIKRFVTNMLKFEGETEGEPLLPKDAFLSSEILEESLEALIGSRLYINISTSVKNDGSKSTWNNLISWKRAKALELPL